MKINLKSTPDPLNFEGTNERGQKIHFSGKENGVSPMESVLMAMAACSSIDIELFLKKMRQDVKNIDVAVEAERAENPPRIFTKINLKFTITGDVKEEKVQKALDMSMNTYCSVSKMLEKSAVIDYSFEIKKA